MLLVSSDGEEEQERGLAGTDEDEQEDYFGADTATPSQTPSMCLLDVSYRDGLAFDRMCH